MEAVKFLKECNRMCKTVDCCDLCPLRGEEYHCKIDIDSGEEEKVISIVEQWSKEHPITTNIDMFIRVFGHVENNIPSLTWWQEEYKKPNEC